MSAGTSTHEADAGLPGMPGTTTGGTTTADALGGRPRRPARPGRARRRIALAAAVAALLLLAALAFAPQAARNLVTSVAAADERVSITHGGTTASLVAPAGWHVVRPLGGDTVALESPDSRVEFAFTLTTRADGAQPGPAALGGDAAAGTPEWSVEAPRPGLVVTYARLATEGEFGPGGLFGTGLFADGSPEHPVLVATAAPQPPSASGAVVDITVTSDVPVDDYLTEFARITAGLEFA